MHLSQERIKLWEEMKHNSSLCSYSEVTRTQLHQHWIYLACLKWPLSWAFRLGPQRGVDAPVSRVCGSGPDLFTHLAPLCAVWNSLQPACWVRSRTNQLVRNALKSSMSYILLLLEALNPGCCSFQQRSKRSLSSFIVQAKKEQEFEVVTITFCPLIQQLKHFSAHRLFKALARQYPGDRANGEAGLSSVCQVTHTHKAFKSHCLKKDHDVLIRCMGFPHGKTEIGT